MTKHKKNIHKKPRQMNLCYMLLHDPVVSQTIARFLIPDEIHIMSTISSIRNPWISMWFRIARFTHAEWVPKDMFHQIRIIIGYYPSTIPVLPRSLTSL